MGPRGSLAKCFATCLRIAKRAAGRAAHEGVELRGVAGEGISPKYFRLTGVTKKRMFLNFHMASQSCAMWGFADEISALQAAWRRTGASWLIKNSGDVTSGSPDRVVRCFGTEASVIAVTAVHRCAHSWPRHQTGHKKAVGVQTDGLVRMDSAYLTWRRKRPRAIRPRPTRIALVPESGTCGGGMSPPHRKRLERPPPPPD